MEMFKMPHYCGRPMSYKTLEEALILVKNAVKGEKEDELFYDYLISVAPTQEEKEIIASIRDDERKHNKMFREIYKAFTGQEITAPKDIEFKKPKTYIEGIKKALFGELAAVERYRDIRAGLPNRYYGDMVFEILTDELKHASKYNYILSTNQTVMSRSSKPNMSSTTKARQFFRINKDEYTPDQWVMYIEPLVQRALEEVKQGINLEHLFQEFILSGVLVGRGYTPQEAIEQVEIWETTGESKLLKESKMKK
ncbi:ferritin-like domain-containing protein [Clostridium sp. ZS2-4]|uniref:ferritin-like domain-containing protein n=1 Tax=Clostridium sp. ZS2-4 TaxID=2987703 RepID=UPI00227D3707|nr:ferritin-like domain-containing protein [Clostridium sp. ZS2-4]MCY6356244.1 ferritin-like domain-containing protein [Clostridium sp. ZS2-4]